jgi:hypothetical protein
MPIRNPYLLLGVDYGCPPDQARRSFARAARRIRRAGTSGITIEDLNWALHEIQNSSEDPFESVSMFRVPANPDVFVPAGEGLFAPPAVPLARATTTSPADVDVVVDGLALDAWELIAAVTPRITEFDYGYRTPGGAHV